MKCKLLLAATLAFVAGCHEEQAPRVAVSVELLPSTITFDALYATAVVVATVKDQHGDVMWNAAVRWKGDGGNLGVILTDSGRTATIQSLEAGPVDVIATSGTGSARLDVITTQVPATIAKESGDNQTAIAGRPLPKQLIVAVRDRGGTSMPFDAVIWTVDGGGSVAPLFADKTGPKGVTWTLGPASNPTQHATAAVPGVGSVRFTATATPASTGSTSQ
jgi:hypothetical protein